MPILLSSLSSQTNKNFEVIISEGRSEDKTKEKALEFKDSLDIKVYNSNKKNLCYQRNFGAKKAKGNYVIFLDADHWVDKNFIELIFKEIAETNVDVIIPAATYDTKKLFWRIYSLASNILVRVIYAVFRKPLGSGPTVIIKKNIFEKIGGYDESIFYFEDHSLLQLAKDCGAKIRHSKKVKIYSSTRRMEKMGIVKHATKKYYRKVYDTISDWMEKDAIPKVRRMESRVEVEAS